jgi:Ca-activated chloride channel family protein
LAKDVKTHVEFNPKIVQLYRLVGYENRLLNEENFNDDTKGTREIGAGHSVTTLYEIVLVEAGNSTTQVDLLRYQDNKTGLTSNMNVEILTVKFRYKSPNGSESKLIERNLSNTFLDLKNLSHNYNFYAAVAE